MPSPDSHFVLRLPRHALRILGIAFAAGLALFVLVWLVGRRSDAFYTADTAASAASASSVALPAPAADADGASGMRAPNADAVAANNAPTQPSPFDAGNAPVPLDETPPQVPSPQTPAAEAAPPAQVAPASPTQADTSLPVPIQGQNPPPEYPASAMRKNETGHVLLRVQVDAGGKPHDVEVIEKSGTRSLDRAAVDAVEQWRFTPAQKDGQPIAASIDIPFDFDLQH